MNELWTNVEKEAWNRMYYRSLDLSMKIYLAKLPESKMPVLELKTDDGSWTNNVLIHIGTGNTNIHNEKEMMLWTTFLLGHEIQHVLSTTDKSWNYGLNGGFQAICEEFSKIAEPKPRRFVKETDYDLFLKDMAKEGYHISKTALQNFVHFIVNSLEDGRIERIRCLHNPGFLNYVKICRGQSWNDEPIPDEMKNQMDEPRVYLSIVLNQLLTLSTMSIYQKGFGTIAADHAHVHRLIQNLIPHVRNAVGSGTCRGCMVEAIEICRILAPEIIEACKLTPLEELLSQLMQIFSQNQSFTADSRTEETGEGGKGQLMAIFGNSDLEESRQDEDHTSSGKNEKNENDSSKEQKDGTKENSSDEKKSDSHDNSNGTGGIAGADSSNQLDSPSNTGNHEEKNHNHTASEAVEAAMKEAYQASCEELDISIRSGRIPKREIPKEDISVSQKDSLPDLTSVNEKYGNTVDFTEQKRQYKPNKQMPVELLSRARNLKRKVEKIFKSQDAPTLRGQNKGKIDAHKVYKLVMNQMDFFKRQQQADPFEGCVYILMDNSGSMGCGRLSKRYYCCSAAAVIEHAFSEHVLLKITAFDAQSGGTVAHKLVKDWHETVHSNAAWNFYEQDTCGYGNKDGYSIRVASKELLARSEKNKMLIVLSDGLPSAYPGGRSQGINDVREAVKEARKAGIKVIAIYIEKEGNANGEDTKDFCEMYQTNCIVTRPELIEDELVRILKRFCFH